MAEPRRVRFVVPPECAGLRLDRALAAGVEGLSRTRARVLLDLGGGFVDGARVKIASRTVRRG
jgi:23S rRNA pseudouridine1911/1915/1917 synthase